MTPDNVHDILRQGAWPASSKRGDWVWGWEASKKKKINLRCAAATRIFFFFSNLSARPVRFFLLGQNREGRRCPGGDSLHWPKEGGDAEKKGGVF